MKSMGNNGKLFIGIFATAVICGFVFYLQAIAFNGPTQAPPNGAGIFAAGTADNMAVGTSTAASNATLLLVGSTTDSTAYGLEVLNSAGSSLMTVRNDGVISFGTETISAGSFVGSLSAGYLSTGSFGSNTGGGNYSFPGNLTATTGTIALASTTINGNATTTSLSVTGVTNATCLKTGANGAVSAGTCSSGGGTVTTSTAVVANNFAYWNASAGSGLNGSSTLSISGTTLTQANAFIVGGIATFKGGIVSTSTTMDTVSATTCGTSPSISGSNGIGRVTTGSNASSTCTVTFGTAFANTPICTVSQQSTITATTTLEITPSTSKLIISMSSSTAFKSMVIDYICIGQ